MTTTDPTPQEYELDPAKRAELDKIVASNAAKETRLLEEFGATLNKSDATVGRFTLMFETLFPAGSPERLEFEIEWQKVIQQNLDNALSELSKTTHGLALPAAAKQKLLVVEHPKGG